MVFKTLYLYNFVLLPESRPSLRSKIKRSVNPYPNVNPSQAHYTLHRTNHPPPSTPTSHPSEPPSTPPLLTHTTDLLSSELHSPTPPFYWESLNTSILRNVHFGQIFICFVGTSMVMCLLKYALAS